MRYIFIDMAWDEYLFWQKNDKQKINKINELLKDISKLLVLYSYYYISINLLQNTKFFELIKI